MGFLLIPGYIQLLAGIILLFVCLAANALWIIRLKLKLRPNDFVSALMDTLIPFIGGGNSRMEHRFENWFFGILLIGAFFITSIFAGDLLDCVIQILNQKITTIGQLAKFDSPIYPSWGILRHTVEIQNLISMKIGWHVSFGKNSSRKNAIIYVVEAERVEYWQTFLTIGGNDFDVLTDTLGTIITNLVLVSDRYVSQRQLKIIDKASATLIESGIDQFYTSFAAFKQKFVMMKELTPEEDEDLQALTLDQLRRPMIFIAGLWILATILFVAENAHFKFMNWRACRIHPLNRIRDENNLPRNELNYYRRFMRMITNNRMYAGDF